MIVADDVFLWGVISVISSVQHEASNGVLHHREESSVVERSAVSSTGV